MALAGEEIAFTPYSPRAWERWCHATYGGRVYYWTQGDVLQPVHFDAHWLHTPEFTTRDAQGQPLTVGGQMRRSKRYRAPNHGQRVSISSGFRPVVRREWSGGTLHVPRCSLYVDCQPAWWKPGVDCLTQARPLGKTRRKTSTRKRLRKRLRVLDSCPPALLPHPHVRPGDKT